MSGAVAIIAVAGTTAVGLVGVASTVVSEFSRRRWEAREERAVEIRALLDVAGGQISAALRAFDKARESGTPKQLGRERLTALEARLDEMWASEDRLAVRLGNDAQIVGHFKSAHEDVRRATAGLWERWRDIAQDQRIYGDFMQLRDRAVAEQGSYFNATNRLLGMKPRRK